MLDYITVMVVLPCEFLEPIKTLIELFCKIIDLS